MWRGGAWLAILLVALTGTAPAAGDAEPPAILLCAETARTCRPLAPEAAARFVAAVRRVEAALPEPLAALLELPSGSRRLPARLAFTGGMALADATGRVTHLLAGWMKTDEVAGGRIAALFAVEGKDRLRLLATFPRGPHDTPQWPLRIDAAVLYGDRGPPVIHLRLHAGGAETILNVADHLVEFSPWLRILDLRDLDYWMGSLHELDDTPPPELVLFDGRWIQYYYFEMNAGPWVLTIATVEDGRLVPACDRHPEVYRRRLEELEARIRELLTDPTAAREWAQAQDPFLGPDPLHERAVVAETITTRLLTALQVGWVEEAERDLHRLETFLRGDPRGRARIERVRADFRPLLAAVRARPWSSCRLHGLDVGSVTGRLLYAPPLPPTDGTASAP